MIKRLITLFFTFFLLIACDKKADPNILRVGISPDYPPFAFLEDNKIVGFDVDLINLIAQQIGKKVEMHNMEFPMLIAALKSGKVDCIISGVAPTEERKKSIDFSAPYHQDNVVIVSLQDKPIPTIEALEGKKVGVQSGTTYEGLATEMQKKIKFTLVSRSLNDLLIEELKTGRIDAIVIGLAQVTGYAKRNPQLTFMNLPEELMTIDTTTAIGFNKGSSLVTQVNEAIKMLVESGEATALEAKWSS